MLRKKQRRPRQDRDAEIDQRQQRDEIVHTPQMKEDAKADGHELGREKTNAESRRRYSRAN